MSASTPPRRTVLLVADEVGPRQLARAGFGGRGLHLLECAVADARATSRAVRVDAVVLVGALAAAHLVGMRAMFAIEGLTSLVLAASEPSEAAPLVERMLA